MFAYSQQSALPVVGTASENERAYPMRVAALARLAMLGYALMFLGTLSAIAGIVILVYQDYDAFPLTTGCQIWSGAFMFAIGLVSVIASRTTDNLRQDITPSLKCKIGAMYGMASASMGICGVAAGYSIAGVIICTGEKCSGYHNEVIVVFEYIAILVILVMLTLGLYGMIFFCKNRHYFQMRNYRDQQSLLQHQIQNLQAQVDQLESQRSSENYGGVDEIGNNEKLGLDNRGFTNWNTPPPAYTK